MVVTVFVIVVCSVWVCNNVHDKAVFAASTIMVLFIVIDMSDRTNNLFIIRYRNTVVFPVACHAVSAQYSSTYNTLHIILALIEY